MARRGIGHGGLHLIVNFFTRHGAITAAWVKICYKTRIKESCRYLRLSHFLRDLKWLFVCYLLAFGKAHLRSSFALQNLVWLTSPVEIIVKFICARLFVPRTVKFDLVNLQQRAKKSFEPMRPITAEVISVNIEVTKGLPRPQPSPGRMFTVLICHTRHCRKRQNGALKARSLVKAKTFTYTSEETSPLCLP